MSFPSADRGAPVVIAGAGLAGLTAGHVLRAAGTEYLILEAGDRPGGLCRTEVVDGFTFDYTGHLLHLREGESRDLILDRVGHRLREHVRRASVYVEGTLVDYPIQAHFGQLPPPLGQKCLEEMLEATRDRSPGDLAFDRWAVRRFGQTLAGLFMIPYNTKLYVHPLGEMETSWTSWSVPVPTEDELRAIARGDEPPAYGYNATFFYPAEEGIEILPRSLAGDQEGSIRTGARISGVDARDRTVKLESGERIRYSTLISTVPLPEFLAMADGLGGRASLAAGKLRHSSVLGVCLGLSRPVLSRDHWVYFPDRSLPFYRVGFPVNFSDSVAPEGCGSLYAEAAYSGSHRPDADEVARMAVETLTTAGLLEPSTRIEARLDLDIPCAYVFHDAYRARNLGAVLDSLRAVGIVSAGRYGAWEYSAMQDAVQWGLEAAREALA